MVAVSFLTATLKKCFFTMLWLKIKNNPRWYLKVNFHQPSIFQEHAAQCCQSRKPKWCGNGKRRAKLGNRLGKGNIHQSFSTSCLLLTLYSLRLFLLKLLLFWVDYLIFLLESFWKFGGNSSKFTSWFKLLFC